MKLSEILHNYGSPLYTEIGNLIFVWSGGPYIDIFRRDVDGSVEITDACINVWNYESDKTTIPFTIESLIAEAKEWVEGY